MSLDPFLGLWRLDPEASDYGAMPTPSLGIYSILGDAKKLSFFARWTLADQVSSVAFDAVPDGAPLPLPQDPAATLTTTMTDGALESLVEKDGVALHRARRTIVEDGMWIEQELASPDGPVRFGALYRRTETKQVLVYRRDLNMRKGKIAAQCAHASMAVFFRRNLGTDAALHIPLDGPMALWSRGRFAKVVLSVESEADLLKVHELAQAMQLPTALITDSGKTEFGGVPTRTTVAVGPAAVEEVDQVTGPSGRVATKLA